jgi:hypothetical protein
MIVFNIQDAVGFDVIPIKCPRLLTAKKKKKKVSPFCYNLYQTHGGPDVLLVNCVRNRQTD